MDELQYENESGTLLVSYRKAHSHHMAINHFHSTYEIFYLMSGQRTFFIQDRTIDVNEGDIVIISPNILHRTTNRAIPQHERLIINVHERYMTAWLDRDSDPLQLLADQAFTLISVNEQERGEVEGIARKIIAEITGKLPGFAVYAQTLTTQLLLHCSRLIRRSRSEQPALPSPMHARIFEIVRYINGHYMEEISLHSLAERFYVSPYYLSRFFKEATGFTFVEYLNNVRVKEAKKMLIQSPMKVSAIARKAGFGSVTHFGRVFKQVTGHNPLYYRGRE